jgi:hypothetical protein
MKVNKKWMLIISGCFIILIMSYFFFFKNSEPQMNKSISMAGMFIEEKHHHIEPGQFMEMWFIGYNAYDKEENRERYKIYVEDAMTYNLLEEGKVYMVCAESFRKDKEYDYAFQLTQISNQEKYQLTGKGRIK